MGVVLRETIDGATLIVWDIEETEEQFNQLVSEEDQQSANQFSNLNRRLEHLAWRAAIRGEQIQNKIIYTSCGSPALENSQLNIGVAHTKGVAVVIIDDKPCAVDIESKDRAFRRTTTERFISSTEKELLASGHSLFNVTMWCAKETLYKYSGQNELDFIEDLKVTHVDIENGELVGSITPHKKPVGMHIKLFNNYLITYIA